MIIATASSIIRAPSLLTDLALLVLRFDEDPEMVLSYIGLRVRVARAYMDTLRVRYPLNSGLSHDTLEGGLADDE